MNLERTPEGQRGFDRYAPKLPLDGHEQLEIDYEADQLAQLPLYTNLADTVYMAINDLPTLDIPVTWAGRCVVARESLQGMVDDGFITELDSIIAFELLRVKYQEVYGE